jgi:drug/metabolite transporter (DMT)-like permease
MAENIKQNQQPTSWVGLLNLFIVYVVWGSTYLAIRVGVREGSGFPPFTLAATRVVTASILLLGFAALQHQRLKLTRREVLLLGTSGLLLWVGGNGLVSWAEQRVDSGLAALILGATPLCVATIESVIDRRVPSRLLIGSLLVGFGGIVLLSMPVLLNGVRGDALSVVALLVGAATWGTGTILQSRRPVHVSPAVSSGVQHLAGGMGLAIVALLRSEPVPTPSPSAWLAWGYLVLIGSFIAFTAFVRALRLLPTNVVMTYAYVNPVIAVLLGWIILNERITGWTLGGMVLVLIGVAGVFQNRRRADKQ